MPESHELIHAAEPMDAQLARVRQAFIDAFGEPPTHAAAAPGRVNLIGEHIDYCDGFVLPIAIQHRAVVVARPRPDHTARLRSTALPGQATLNIDEAPIALGEPDWSRYLRGVIASSYTPTGFDLLLDCTVPSGGGLSSSAAIEVACAACLDALAELDQDPMRRALLCQTAEHRFGGTPCGIMDQCASSLCQAGHALLLDCRDRSVQHVPLDDPGLAVLIANSNAPHELSGGEYAERRQQCAEARSALGLVSWREAGEPHVQQLAELSQTGHLAEPVFRRGRHVVGEIARTVDAAEALKHRDWPRFGQRMIESHASLRDDFEVSTPELDRLVDLALEQQGQGVLGSRMTGGGFGGCTVTLCQAESVPALAQHLHDGYTTATGQSPTLFVTTPGPGAQTLPLD